MTRILPMGNYGAEAIKPGVRYRDRRGVVQVVTGGWHRPQGGPNGPRPMVFLALQEGHGLGAGEVFGWSREATLANVSEIL